MAQKIRCKTRCRTPIRVSRELKQIINYVKARYLLAGKTPPSGTEITKIIAKKIKKEELLSDAFIRF